MFENDLFKENGPEKPFYENSLCTDIHTLISWEALLRPTSDGLELTRQLEVLQKLRGYSATQLYCEILRACCLGLAETADSPGELRWAVFTFLKAPLLLLRLHRSIFGMNVCLTLRYKLLKLNSPQGWIRILPLANQARKSPWRLNDSYATQVF